MVKKCKRVVLKLMYLLVGRVLYRSKTWAHIRKHCFNYPGKNFHEEIKQDSAILFYLNIAYYEYFEFRIRKSPHRKWQKLRWDDYGYYYNNARKDVLVNEGFHKYMDKIASDTNEIIEIGCGGFSLTKKIAARHHNLKIIGYDISNDSEIRYETDIKPKFDNIKFFKSCIFEKIECLESIPYFYTYNVLMHFDENDIGEFFRKIKAMKHPVYGLLDEPYTTKTLSDNYKSRDYRHNYLKYFQQFNFCPISFPENSEGYGVFYFKTK